jgi:hypothetical protein
MEGRRLPLCTVRSPSPRQLRQRYTTRRRWRWRRRRTCLQKDNNPKRHSLSKAKIPQSRARSGVAYRGRRACRKWTRRRQSRSRCESKTPFGDSGDAIEKCKNATYRGQRPQVVWPETLLNAPARRQKINHCRVRSSSLAPKLCKTRTAMKRQGKEQDATRRCKIAAPETQQKHRQL